MPYFSDCVDDKGHTPIQENTKIFPIDYVDVC